MDADVLTSGLGADAVTKKADGSPSPLLRREISENWTGSEGSVADELIADRRSEAVRLDDQ